MAFEVTRDKMHGLWVTTRKALPQPLGRIIGSYLVKKSLAVDLGVIVNSDMAILRHMLNGLFFSNPIAAIYEGKYYVIGAQWLLPIYPGGEEFEPYIAPSIYPDNDFKVTYEHGTIDMHDFAPGFAVYDLNNIIFKGLPVQLLRGIGSDGYGHVGPRVVSRRSRDQCMLHLPVISCRDLNNFTMRELLDAQWSLHYVKGSGYQMIEPDVGRIIELGGVLRIEVNWGYGS